jgi:hypothetical protein
VSIITGPGADIGHATAASSPTTARWSAGGHRDTLVGSAGIVQDAQPKKMTGNGFNRVTGVNRKGVSTARRPSSLHTPPPQRRGSAVRRP